MKISLVTVEHTIAGLAGRMILFSYKVYISFFSARKDDSEMMGRIPVKREILLLKKRYKTSACSLN